jgi:hypothetical protein
VCGLALWLTGRRRAGFLRLFWIGGLLFSLRLVPACEGVGLGEHFGARSSNLKSTTRLSQKRQREGILTTEHETQALPSAA